jgi:chromate transporter
VTDAASTGAEPIAPPPLRSLLAYFLKLGAIGFGGPIALAGYMQRDLVEERRWIARDDYLQGLALAQLMPGPLAAQLAMYLGWVRAGVLGATLVAAAFIVPSFVMVLALSAAYVRYSGLAFMQGVFYGVGAAVIAIVARSAVKLVKMTIRRDPLLWVIFAANAGVVAWTERELVWLFIGSGAIALLIKAPPAFVRRPPAAAVALGPWAWLVTGLHDPAGARELFRVAVYFAEAGAFVFGSGLAIVPFLHSGVVDRYHWLTDRQFLDAVAVAMITPGPVVITVAFIGYLAAGPAGAALAALGVFVPCWLGVIVPAPYYRRFAGNPSVKAFVSGVTSAATGAIAGAAFVLGRRAIVDVPTIAILVGTFVIVTFARKIPEPLVIVAAGVIGLALKGVAP